jgi:hypothetical protein
LIYCLCFAFGVLTICVGLQERLAEGKNLIERSRRQMALREQRRQAAGVGGNLGYSPNTAVNSATSSSSTSGVQLTMNSNSGNDNSSYSPPITPVKSYKSYGRVVDDV